MFLLRGFYIVMNYGKCYIFLISLSVNFKGFMEVVWLWGSLIIYLMIFN